MKLFVGNLSFDVKDEDLRAAFEPFGQVDSASVIRERGTSESRGFGFVEMPSRDQAQKAVDEMNGKEFMGRALNVNEARPMPERPRMGGGGFSGHRLDSRRRDGSKRKSGGGHKGRNQRFGNRRPH